MNTEDKQVIEKFLLEALDPDRVSSKDFEEIVEVLVDFAVAGKELNKKQHKEMVSAFEELRRLFVQKQKKEVKKLESNVAGFLVNLKKTIDKRLSNIKNGEDGEPGKDADEKQIVKNVVDALRGEFPESDTPEDIRDKLENLVGNERLDVSAIRGLEKQLRKLRKSIKTGGGGGVTVFGSSSHAPVHESFAMDGATTDITLRNAVEAQGTAIMVRYQGQMLDMTTHYTVDGNKVSLTFTPDNNTTISVTYWP